MEGQTRRGLKYYSNEHRDRMGGPHRTCAHLIGSATFLFVNFTQALASRSPPAEWLVA